MNPLKLKDTYLKTPISIIIDDFNDLRPLNYKIDYENIFEILEYIKKNERKYYDELVKKVLFVVSKVATTNEFNEPYYDSKYGGEPEHGFELIDKKHNIGLGIYHAHISYSNNRVLLWYVIWLDGQPSIHFDYITHPDDNYEKILKEIYARNDGGYNISQNDYFINIKTHVSPITENKIFNFKEFIKNIF